MDRFEYREPGLARLVDGLRQETTFSYDALGKLAETRYSDGRTEHVELDAGKGTKPSPQINVAEALRYAPPAEGRPWLDKLLRHPDPLVASEARKSSESLAKPGAS